MAQVCSEMATRSQIIQGRVRQFRNAALPWTAGGSADDALRRIVENDRQWSLLERLSAFDREHHLQVYSLLVKQGERDSDLLLAAALHDVGKADERMRVALPHRVLKVLLGATLPGVLVRLSRWDNWLGHGLFLATRHPELGALLARQAGASERSCDLIRFHHRPLAEIDDPALRALILADDEAGG